MSLPPPDPAALDRLVERFTNALPRDLRLLGEDAQSALRAAMASALQRMELVTREEFDVQAELLERTREKLELLEERVAVLEGHGPGEAAPAPEAPADAAEPIGDAAEPREDAADPKDQ